MEHTTPIRGWRVPGISLCLPSQAPPWGLLSHGFWGPSLRLALHALCQLRHLPGSAVLFETGSGYVALATLELGSPGCP